MVIIRATAIVIGIVVAVAVVRVAVYGTVGEAGRGIGEAGGAAVRVRGILVVDGVVIAACVVVVVVVVVVAVAVAVSSPVSVH